MMKRPISYEDQEWFDKHQDRRNSAIGTPLINHGVIYYYDNHGINNSRFHGNYILVFENNMLADWSAPNIEQLASSLL